MLRRLENKRLADYELVPKECNNYWYFFRVCIQSLLVLVLLGILLGCTKIEYVKDRSSITVISAVLEECIATPVGYVGSTNISLAKGYIQSTESLFICKGIAREIQLLNKEE